MIEAYKCFNEGLFNLYNERFEVGIVYHLNNEIKFHKNGFHMCKNLEDTLRYFDSFNNNIEIAKVRGFGNIDKYDDYYNEFFDMYATEYMIIDHILTRKEIIEYTSNMSEMGLKRFLSLYRLNNEELAYFREKYRYNSMIMNTIQFYQNNLQLIKKIKK